MRKVLSSKEMYDIEDAKVRDKELLVLVFNEQGDLVVRKSVKVSNIKDFIWELVMLKYKFIVLG